MFLSVKTVIFILTSWDIGWIKYIQVYEMCITVPVTEQIDGSYCYGCDCSKMINT